MCKIKLYAFPERIYPMLKSFVLSGFFFFQMLISQNARALTPMHHNNDTLSQAAQTLLLTVKRREPAGALLSFFQTISPEALISELNTDNKKKAFWLNIYNAFIQLLLSDNPAQYKKRGLFFGKKQINIAGKLLSLDAIEHGLLRRSKTKWSLGYINRLFPSDFEKKNRVVKVDYRIHFALNCGAKSCPPIAFYRDDQLDRQLDLATKIYLKSETVYDSADNRVALPAIMGWFRADFGGKNKMIELLKQTGVIPPEVRPAVSFRQYDWNLYLDNYKTE